LAALAGEFIKLGEYTMHIHQLLRPAVCAVAAITGGLLLTTAPARFAGSGPISDVTFDGCDLRALRPLQGGVGLGEVMKKKRDIEEDLQAELDDLKNHPIQVVRGLGGDLFVIDHHHGARAWIEANHPTGTCQILDPDPPLSTEPEKFWAELEARGWVRLADENGKPINPDALPKTLQKLPDDPYRTLAWMLRKADGFCRARMTPSPPPFAEFRWADWMRGKSELPFDKVAAATNPELWNLKKKDRVTRQKEVLDAALAASKSPEAATLPGYRGDEDPSSECPPDPPGGGE
jgi:hypothetical protein